MSDKRFRIAFSFAGEKRDFVAEVAAILAKQFGQDAILMVRVGMERHLQPAESAQSRRSDAPIRMFLRYDCRKEVICMLTTIEAEIDVNGQVTLLEPIKLTKKSRAIVTVLENGDGSKKQMSEEEARLAEERFARWIGAWDSGDPNSADNERIDEYLAREYGNELED